MPPLQNITAQPGKQARLLLGSEVAAAFGPALGFYVSKVGALERQGVQER